MNTVISAKVPEEMKRKADMYGIRIGELVREALKERIRAIEGQMLSSQLDDISGKIGAKVRREDVARAVRSSRDER